MPVTIKPYFMEAKPSYPDAHIRAPSFFTPHLTGRIPAKRHPERSFFLAFCKNYFQLHKPLL
jgi:hypothetical protein